MKKTRAQLALVYGSVDAGAHRAATGRERRADVTLCDSTNAELLQQRCGTFRSSEPDRDDSIWRAAPFRSRLCGCRQRDHAPFLAWLALLVWLWLYGHRVLVLLTFIGFYF